ncbi:MAG: hypothetical protein ACKOWD_18040 [Rhodoferax sp.]
MATPNYGYEKRQKELAKKRKKEDKLKSKSERKVGGDHDDMAAQTSPEAMEGVDAGGTPRENSPSGAM